MTQQQTDLVSELEQKVQTLTKMYRDVVAEKNELSHQVAMLKIELGNQRIKVAEQQTVLQDNNLVNASGLSLEQATANRDRLLNLLREIDKCISMLKL